jgi:hypothetical protein
VVWHLSISHRKLPKNILQRKILDVSGTNDTFRGLLDIRVANLKRSPMPPCRDRSQVEIRRPARLSEPMLRLQPPRDND